jgi:NADPH:quinone reductase-like Zn-dependent oxidoreductase
MKAIYANNYGSSEVLEIREVSKPVIKDDEILVHVMAFSVNVGDSRIRRADPQLVRLAFGLTKPRNPVLGTTFTGVIEEVGSQVTNYQVGQSIYGSTGMQLGTHAEYCKVKANGVIGLKPDNMSHAEAATLFFGGATAIHFLDKLGDIQGQDIAIYGASGAVGSAMVQIAKARGAKVSTFTSAESIPTVARLGADNTYDYLTQPLNKHNHQYDILIECVNKTSIQDCLLNIKPNGTLISIGGLLKEMVAGPYLSRSKHIRFITGMADEKVEQIQELNQLVANHKLLPVTDSIYPHTDFKQANDRVDSGKKRGNVVVIWGEV